MKALLTIVGIIALVVGLIGYAAYHGQELDASSKAYVEENIPPIISTWSKDEFFKRSSPEMQKHINENPEHFDQLFQKVSRLGDMKSFGDVKGNAYFSYSLGNDNTTTASYTATAKFENGDGEITVNLTQPSDQWKIYYFNVNSPLFLK